MRKIIFIIASLLGIAILVSSCQKEEFLTGNAQVNFDAAYVVNSESNSISIINLFTNQVDKTIDLTSFKSSQGMGQAEMDMSKMWPYHISLSPDKSKLAIAAPEMDFSDGYNMSQTTGNTSSSAVSHSQHHGGGTNSSSVTTVMPGRILILNAVTGELIKELVLEGMSMNAIFSTDGKELWTAIMIPEGKVKVFDAVSYALLNTITVGKMPAEITFSDDGKKAFVANGMSNTITVIDATTKQLLETIDVGGKPVGAWPGMDRMMYVDNENGQSISIINSMTNMMTDTLNLGFAPGMAVRNPMMNQMWVSDPNDNKIQFWTKKDNGFIYGGAVTVGSGAHAIAFNKAGNVCFVTNQEDETVSVVDITNLKETMRIGVGKKPNGLVIRYK